jgi:hypothetical protein
MVAVEEFRALLGNYATTEIAGRPEGRPYVSFWTRPRGAIDGRVAAHSCGGQRTLSVPGIKVDGALSG